MVDMHTDQPLELILRADLPEIGNLTVWVFRSFREHPTPSPAPRLLAPIRCPTEPHSSGTSTRANPRHGVVCAHRSADTHATGGDRQAWPLSTARTAAPNDGRDGPPAATERISARQPPTVRHRVTDR